MHKISNSVRLTLYFNGLTLLIFHGKKTIEPQGLSDHLPTLTIQHSVCSEILPMDFIMAFFFLLQSYLFVIITPTPTLIPTPISIPSLTWNFLVFYRP